MKLVLGAIASGKSAYAEVVIRDIAGGQPLGYVATMDVSQADPEMRDKVAKHQRRRGEDWQLVQSFGVGVLQEAERLSSTHAVLLDGIGLAVAKEPHLDRWLGALERFHPSPQHEMVIVSDETGWGLVPVDAATRHFVTVLGRVNQQLACIADQVTVVIAGVALVIKGGKDG